MKQTTIWDALLIICLVIMIFTRCKTYEHGNMGGYDTNFRLTELVKKIDSIEDTKIKTKKL